MHIESLLSFISYISKKKKKKTRTSLHFPRPRHITSIRKIPSVHDDAFIPLGFHPSHPFLFGEKAVIVVRF